MTHRALATGFVGLFAVGCGARSFDLDVYHDYLDASASVDAGPLSDATASDARPDTGGGGGGGGLTGPGGPLAPDSSIVECGTCLTTGPCGADVLACVTDTTCTSALPCVAQNCLSGNILACATTCGLTSDPTTMGLATCVLLECSSCISALGSVGSLLGGTGLLGDGGVLGGLGGLLGDGGLLGGIPGLP